MKKLYSVLVVLFLFSLSIFAQPTINSLRIDGGAIVAGGYYNIPIIFSGNDITAIETTIETSNGIYFNLQDNTTVSINEWPYYSFPTISFDPTSSNNLLRLGLINSETFGGQFKPIKIKFYAENINIERTTSLIKFSSAIFTNSNYHQHSANTSGAIFTVFNNNNGIFGGNEGIISAVKMLDVSTGKLLMDIKNLVFYDVSGDLVVDSFDAYLKMLKYFNRINQYPVETGREYWQDYTNNTPSGSIVLEQQPNKVLLNLPKNITNGDLKFKLPKGAWIEKVGNGYNSINGSKENILLSFINNSESASSVIIHGIKNLSELSISGTINNGIPVKIQSSVTSIEETNSIPTEFKLEQNYPNPFNPSTTISYSLPTAGFTTLKVYDVIGKEVATLVNEEKAAGKYEATFDASKLSSGIYIYKITAGSFSQIKKMNFLK